MRRYRVEVGNIVGVLVLAVERPGGVAVAPLVQRQDPVVGRSYGCEVVPDVRVVSEAVHEHQRYALLAPLEQVQVQAIRSANASRPRFHGSDANRSDCEPGWVNGLLAL